MAGARVRVELSVRRGAELRPLWYPNGRLGGLTLEGRPPAAVGTPVHLVVRVTEPSVRHLDVQGCIAWARHKGSVSLRECFGVDFLPEDRAGRDRLDQLAKEEISVSALRYEERLSTHLQVTLHADGHARRELLLDLSEGGAFVRTDGPLPVHTEVHLELRPPRSLTKLRLAGRVAWVRETGEPPGMGISFQHDDPATALKLKKVLDHLTRSR